MARKLNPLGKMMKKCSKGKFRKLGYRTHKACVKGEFRKLRRYYAPSVWWQSIENTPPITAGSRDADWKRRSSQSVGRLEDA